MSEPFYIEPADVDDGLRRTLNYFFKDGETARRDSRAGDVLEIPNISIVKWNVGTPFVSMDPIRDANPFFALAESGWMLKGRSDLAFLVHFNSSFGQYSDDGKEVRGSAYGRRWRNWFLDEKGGGIDQIPRLVEELAANPLTRRAVLLMWDAVDLNLDSKDVPCNTQVYFLVRDGKLDMTVTNRSNDSVYGLFGSNVVHFHLLLSYVTMLLRARMSELGKPDIIEQGNYYQVTNNLHVYVDNEVVYRLRGDINTRINHPGSRQELPKPFLAGSLISVHENPGLLESDLRYLCDRYASVDVGWAQSTFGIENLEPMLRAWNLRKAGQLEEALAVLAPRSSAWCQAGAEWLRRRIRAKARKDRQEAATLQQVTTQALSIDAATEGFNAFDATTRD